MQVVKPLSAKFKYIFSLFHVFSKIECCKIVKVHKSKFLFYACCEKARKFVVEITKKSMCQDQMHRNVYEIFVFFVNKQNDFAALKC